MLFDLFKQDRFSIMEILKKQHVTMNPLQVADIEKEW